MCAGREIVQQWMRANICGLRIEGARCELTARMCARCSRLGWRAVQWAARCRWGHAFL